MSNFLAIAEADGDVCSLPQSIGPCRQKIASFYYSPDSGKCEPFIYGGCEGNGNRFQTLIECAE